MPSRVKERDQKRLNGQVQCANEAVKGDTEPNKKEETIMQARTTRRKTPDQGKWSSRYFQRYKQPIWDVLCRTQHPSQCYVTSTKATVTPCSGLMVNQIFVPHINTVIDEENHPRDTALKS